MKKKKGFILLSMLLLVAMFTAACGSSAQTNSTDSSGKTTITLLNSKGEIQQQFLDAAKAFEASNPDIQLQIEQVAAGQSPFERVSTLYASGNPPTMMMVDPSDVTQLKDRVLDLTSEKWVADANGNIKDTDNKVLAFPFSVEGYGFIYNQAVLDKAVGGTFDPKTINTRDALQQLLEQIKAIGVAPLEISPQDWSLGAHFMGINYSAQSKDTAQVSTFIEGLRAGTTDLNQNTVFNGLMDTFDLMMKYNYDQASPLAPTYEKGPELIGKGEVGLWFMGNWAWPQIKSFDTADGKYGFLPVPISNNAADYGNVEVSATISKRIVIDKQKSTPAQQEAAKKFLNWIVYDKEGQNFLVNEVAVLPAFKNITLEPTNPLGKSLKEYIDAGKSMEAVSTLPADHWKEVGSYMQKYLAQKSDRTELADSIETYWKNVK